MAELDLIFSRIFLRGSLNYTRLPKPWLPVVGYIRGALLDLVEGFLLQHLQLFKVEEETLSLPTSFSLTVQRWQHLQVLRLGRHFFPNVAT